jgi:hypothetical protein
MKHKFMNVTARYPKLNQPYVWSDKDNAYVGCNWDANGAAFYLDAYLSNEQWQEADKLIKEVWKEFVAEQEKAGKPVKKPNEMRNPLDEEDGKGYVKMKLRCYDENFELTSGSNINCKVIINAYRSGAHQGITLRLTDVMVNELAERQEAPIDFDPNPNGGFVYQAEEEAAPVVQEKVLFGDMEAEVSTESKNDFEDEIPF